MSAQTEQGGEVKGLNGTSLPDGNEKIKKSMLRFWKQHITKILTKLL